MENRKIIRTSSTARWTALRWIGIIPTAIAGAFFGSLLGWLSWEFLDLLPFSLGSWDSTGITLFRSLYCPFAFVSAGAAMAPAFHFAVAIVLAALYAGFEVSLFFARPTSDQWLHGIPALILSIVCSGLSVPATLEYLASEDVD